MPQVQSPSEGNFSPRQPAYRRHKASGQAVVTLCGHDVYLGPYGSAKSRAEYDRRLSEWLANGRQLPASSPTASFTISELAAAYWRFAKVYYRKNGELSGSIPGIKIALRFLKNHYGLKNVSEFGPLALRALLLQFVEAGQCRTYANDNLGRIKRIFKWGVSQELVPVTVYQALMTVPGLKKGRTNAREPEPIRPVGDALVDAVLHLMPPIVADMVRIQRLTGCRPGEICTLRPCDIDRSNKEVWAYRPSHHKTEHHGAERVVAIGPKAQGVLLPYLDRDPNRYCFVPAESEAKRLQRLRQQRKSKVQPSQQSRKKVKPRRKPGERYTPGAYRKAIQRACRTLEVECWFPNRLRHSAATEIRKQFGLEAAQVTLGHSRADVSQIYAERNNALAAEVMRQIG